MNRSPLLAFILATSMVWSTDTLAESEYNYMEDYQDDAYERVNITPEPTQNTGNISFISGGVGEEEQELFKQTRADYNTHLLFAARNSGAYLSNVKVDIIDKAGAVILSTNSQGPYMYIQLPDSNYTIKAVYEGVEQQRSINVKKNSAKNIHFVWDAVI
jgi:hypothetical protein